MGGFLVMPGFSARGLVRCTYEDEDAFDGDIDLVYDLDGPAPDGGGLLASPSGLATSSQAGPVTLETVHGDIQLLTFTVLMVYVVAFVLFIIRKWR